MNVLFNKLATILRKSRNPVGSGSVIPFNVGRIYSCIYKNYKHDPKPLVLIVASDVFYTIGININYLHSMQSNLISVIMMLRQSNKVLTGLMIYQFIKQRSPMVVKLAFRKYFTPMLHGKLVSAGISTAVEPNIQLSTIQFVRDLNRRINPPLFSYNRENFTEQELAAVQNQLGSIQINSAKPAQNAQVSLTYNPVGTIQQIGSRGVTPGSMPTNDGIGGT